MHGDDVASQELQKVQRYHILSFACTEMMWPPKKYIR
jgi:hypothetical protein